MLPFFSKVKQCHQLCVIEKTSLEGTGIEIFSASHFSVKHDGIVNCSTAGTCSASNLEQGGGEVPTP